MSAIAERPIPLTTEHGSHAAPPTSGLRPPEDFCLPKGYRQQTAALTHDGAMHLDAAGTPIQYWNDERIRASARYQRHVYTWAARLVRERGLHSVLDVGCGPGVKLASLIAPACTDVEGIDQPSAIAAAKRLGTPGTLGVVDLESCENVRPWRTFDLIVCADVVEHLLNPDPMLRLLGRLSHDETLILLSTPDRARLRGRACMGSDKPEHVREWSEPEFLRFLRSRGFDIFRTRRLPGDDAPARRGMLREALYCVGLANTSPHRCCTVLCRAGRSA